MADPVVAEFRANQGRVAGLANKHLLLLTVTGRHSGTGRTTPLLYLPDDEAYVVFGLNGGAPRNPAWVGNLIAAGHCEIEVGERTLIATVERATGRDAESLWRRQVALVPEFETFRSRTTRPIPILRLRPLTVGFGPRPQVDRPRGRTELDVEAILFDMDGTLVDSEESINAVWTAFALRHGLDPEQVVAGVHGRTGSEIIADHVTDPEVAAVERRRMVEEQADAADVVREVAGASRLLRALPRAAWAIVTAAPRCIAIRRIAAAGLPMPDVLVSAEDVPRGKPDPEGFLHAARALGATPERCLVLEDSPAGIEAGARAGATVVQVGAPDGGAVHGADLIVPDLTHLRVQARGSRGLHVTVEDHA
ncbi:nitroreductase/quinone reductase family protein [Xylanimonas protaetiae]|uniref:Nitroreductase family deazaflavin-dependent oxidoreductase n=1 Tax=Xylanimonas protaetiae TaxID=2509457 RepID=A0A4P6EZ70_9MICO|nr:nitroreductase/quinone reductase family protein [Xylanimonas protaetiae]QAY68750.1 nitroreductase family deazaflavin-dependent oxidoreductase [Xylanimonas protaetiae]